MTVLGQAPSKFKSLMLCMAGILMGEKAQIQTIFHNVILKGSQAAHLRSISL